MSFADCMLKTRLIEDFLEQELVQCMPDFSMPEFLSELMYVIAGTNLLLGRELFTVLAAVWQSPLPVCLSVCLLASLNNISDCNKFRFGTVFLILHCPAASPLSV